jgi:hypothetical protein
MEAIRQTQKKYATRAMTVGICVALVLILSGYKALGKGVMLGALFSVINFVLIGETLPLRIGKSRKQATAVSLGSILLRYAIMALPLIIAATMETFDFAATAVGIFMVQLVVLSEHVWKTMPFIHHKRL